MNTQLDFEMMNAWKLAAEDLQIRVELPYSMIDSNGVRETFEVYLPDFGGPKGAVLGQIRSGESVRESRKQSGYYGSDLSETYRKYDRQLFIDTLDDLKWFGPENRKPAWYSGKNWS
jgi:hypothetical protein